MCTVYLNRNQGIGCTCWSWDMGPVQLVARERVKVDVVGAREVGTSRMMDRWRGREKRVTGDPSSGFCGT